MCNSADNIIWQITKRGLKKKKNRSKFFQPKKKGGWKGFLKPALRAGSTLSRSTSWSCPNLPKRKTKKTQTIQESLKQTSKFKTVEQNSNVTVTPKHNNRDKISSRRPNIPVYNLSNFGSKFFNLPLEFMYLFLLKKT